MLLSRKKLYRIKKTKKQSRRRRKQRNKKKYKRRKKAGSRRKRRPLNLRKKTMKSYHKGGFNRPHLSFLVPYWNQAEGKQELYIVTQKELIAGSLRNTSNEKQILVNLFLKGVNNNEDDTKRLLKELFKSINNPEAFNVNFKKAIKVEGDGLEGVINKLLESVENITNLNRKLFESQITENEDGTTGFSRRGEFKSEILRILSAMKRQLQEVQAQPDEPQGPEKQQEGQPEVPAQKQPDTPVPGEKQGEPEGQIVVRQTDTPVPAEKQDEPEDDYDDDDFEDPCDPGEKYVDGDCVEDTYDDTDDDFEPEDPLPQDDTQIVPFNPNSPTTDLIERFKELGELCGPLSGECKEGLVCGNKDMSGEGTCIKKAFIEQPTQPDAERKADEETPVQDIRGTICQNDEDCGPGVKCNDDGECETVTFNNEDFDREIRSIFPYGDSENYDNKTIISLFKFQSPLGPDIEMMEINLYNIPENAHLGITLACLDIVLKLFHSPDQASMLDIFNTDPEIQQAKDDYSQLKNLNKVIDILRDLQSQALGGNVRASDAILRDPPTVFLPVFMTYTTVPGTVYREIYPSSPVDFNKRIISDRNIAQEYKSIAQEKLNNMPQAADGEEIDPQERDLRKLGNYIYKFYERNALEFEVGSPPDSDNKFEGALNIFLELTRDQDPTGEQKDALVVSPTGPEGRDEGKNDALVDPNAPQGRDEGQKDPQDPQDQQDALVPVSPTAPTGPPAGQKDALVDPNAPQQPQTPESTETGQDALVVSPGGEQKTQGNPFDYIGTLTTLPTPPSGFTERVIVIERLVILSNNLQTPTYRVVSKERNGNIDQVVKSIKVVVPDGAVVNNEEYYDSMITQALEELGYIRMPAGSPLTATTFNPYPGMLNPDIRTFKPDGVGFTVTGPIKAKKGQYGSVRQYLIAKAPQQLAYLNEDFFNEVTQYCKYISQQETELMVSSQLRLPVAPTTTPEGKSDGTGGETPGTDVNSNQNPEGNTEGKTGNNDNQNPEAKTGG